MTPPDPGPFLRTALATSRAHGLATDSLPYRLFKKAKRLGTWNPDDLDFSRDREDWRGLSAQEKDILLRLTALFVAGEESVTADIVPLLSVVADEGRLEEELFLSAFLFEEAKHVDFFRRFLDEVVFPELPDLDLASFHSPQYLEIFYRELPSSMRALSSDRSAKAQVTASATYNMIVEGVLAETGYRAYHDMLVRRDLMPGLRAGVAFVQRDEARHMAYGVYLISRLVAEHPEIWDAVEERMNELLPLALGLIDEIFALYDPVPFELDPTEFAMIAATNFGRRFQRLEAARGRSLAELALDADDADGVDSEA